MEITKQSLEQSLKEKNDVVSQLTSKTQELQEVSNKLLVKVKPSALIIYIVSLLIHLYTSSDKRQSCEFLCIKNYLATLFNHAGFKRGLWIVTVPESFRFLRYGF